MQINAARSSAGASITFPLPCDRADPVLTDRKTPEPLSANCLALSSQQANPSSNNATAHGGRRRGCGAGTKGSQATERKVVRFQRQLKPQPGLSASRHRRRQ